MTNKTITVARRARLERAVATNNQGPVEGRTLMVVQAWAHMPNQPQLADTLQVLWAAFNGNAAYYVPPDTTGATLLAQDMNVEFPALKLHPSDLDPAGKIVTVGNLVDAI